MPYKDPNKERERQISRRKTPEYKEYQREYQRDWRLRNPDKVKEIRVKSEKKPERIEYRRNWWRTSPKAKEIKERFKEKQKLIQKRKEYQRNWWRTSPKAKLYNQKPERKAYKLNWDRTSPKRKLSVQRYVMGDKKKEADRRYAKKHPDMIKKKYKRYYSSIKGIVNYLKKHDRKKYKIETKDITPELIIAVNERDKNCVYCGKPLPDKPTNKNDIHYDHVNPFKPFSEINIVRCCGSCNHQKSNADALQWCEHKGYKPAKIVYDLLEKDRNRQVQN